MGNKRKWYSILIVGLVLLLASSAIACSPPPPPVIVAFSATPTQISAGESATLLWNVTEATTVSIDQGIGNVSSSENISVKPSRTTTYTLTASNKAATVTESVTVEVKVIKYTLITSVNPPGGGSVSPSSGHYEQGKQINVTATPSTGYTFSHWSGDAIGTSSTTTITMDSNKSVTAHFKSITVRLITSVAPSGVGTITVMPPGGSYPLGTVVTLTAVPAVRYKFNHWSGDASGTTLAITVTMNADKTLVAHFTKIDDCTCYSYTLKKYIPCEQATAICRDGTCSISKSRRGTCSHHGGVEIWLK